MQWLKYKRKYSLDVVEFRQNTLGPNKIGPVEMKCSCHTSDMWIFNYSHNTLDDVVGEFKHLPNYELIEDARITNTNNNVLIEGIKEGCKESSSGITYLVLDDIDPQEDSLINQCIHTWKQYQGFSETYEYCTECDEKRK